MIKHYFILCLMASASFSFGQETDSLMAVWKNKSEADSNRIQAVSTICWKLAFSDADSSIALTKKAVKFADDMNSLSDVVNLYNTMGVASTLKADYLDALDYYEFALDRGRKALYSKDKTTREEGKAGLAQTYINRGILYKNQGNYSEALSNQLKSLAMWEELERKDKLAISYGNIGVIYKHLGELDKALEYQRKSVAIKTELDESNTLYVEYLNIGNIYKLRGETDSAFYYLELSLDLSIKAGHKSSTITAYGNIGNLYSSIGDLSTAIKYQKMCLEIAISTGSKKKIAGAYVDLGDYYLKVKNYNQALIYLNKSLSISNKIGALEEQKFSHKRLAQLYEETGDYKKSLSSYKDYVIIRDSLISESTHRDIDRAEINAEFEKKNYADSLGRDVKSQIEKSEQNRKDDLKEVEIAQEKRLSFYAITGSIVLLFLLVIVILQVMKQKKNNVLLNLQKTKIEKSDQEKEVLIREIHHRVKNNLQIISSLLKSEQRKSSSEEVKYALSYGRQRIEAISLVHEKLYLQTDLTNVDLEDYLMDLAENLLFSYDKHEEIELSIKSSVRNLHADVAVNLGLLTAELITNSIKHGDQPDNGKFKIDVSLEIKEELVSYSYMDNGKGIDKEGSIEVGTSFGIKLIRSIIKKMNGVVIKPTNVTAGFKLFFEFTSKRNE
ncbi:MAG: two-component sensor histidine kinase/Tfp pilus assembly protein PilF [Crocinitomicaceae bacterium]|jgi:two-component sensor histidine kinase/Tfp pilus assembly protein PilF